MLLWLPYTAFSVILLGFMFASFAHFHSRRGNKYRQRREQLLRQVEIPYLVCFLGRSRIISGLLLRHVGIHCLVNFFRQVEIP